MNALFDKFKIINQNGGNLDIKTILYSTSFTDWSELIDYPITWAGGLGVLTLPLQGKDQRFDSASAHQFLNVYILKK